MKKLVWGLVILSLVVGTVFGANMFLTGASASSHGKPAPTVVVGEPVLELSGEVKVVIMGAGFEPGQEIHLIATIRGARSDIGFLLDPEPVVNETGAWITAWGPESYASRKMLTEGAVTIEVTDADYVTIANGVVAFYDPSKPQEEWPSWATGMASE